MSSFPKRKTLLAGSLAFILGAALQLPALAAHHEEQKGDSSPDSTEQPMEHQGRKGGTMMDNQKRDSEMDHESHERMKDMHEDRMNPDDRDHGDTIPDRDTDMEQGGDETEE